MSAYLVSASKSLAHRMKALPYVPRVFGVCMVAAVLVACQESAPDRHQAGGGALSEGAVATGADELVGCYGVVQDEPAQIKISRTQEGFSMQMREPEGAKGVWDAAEPLRVLSIDEGWSYFKVNALDLNKSDAQHIIARTDGVMALMHIKPSVQNINPRLDSPYVMHILQGSNTVYRLPCDD